MSWMISINASWIESSDTLSSPTQLKTDKQSYIFRLWNQHMFWKIENWKIASLWNCGTLLDFFFADDSSCITSCVYIKVLITGQAFGAFTNFKIDYSINSVDNAFEYSYKNTQDSSLPKNVVDQGRNVFETRRHLGIPCRPRAHFWPPSAKKCKFFSFKKESDVLK